VIRGRCRRAEEIDEQRLEFLRKYIKEEDIPQKLAGQKDVHMSTASIIGVSGGNRSGKTMTDVIEDFIFATGEIPSSMRRWYPREKLSDRPHKRMRVIGVDQTQVDNVVIPAYKHWCPKEWLPGGIWENAWSAKRQIVSLKKGKFKADIEFMTNKQDLKSFAL